MTTKKIYTRALFAELAWLCRGYTNVKWLNERGCTIWDEWADENGNLGPIYGAQWRRWDHVVGVDNESEGIDQLQNAVDLIRNDPDSRRIIVSAWNPGDLPLMALSPCHMSFQFEVHEGVLSCHMYQRSADVFLGVPFNIASYAALTSLIAQMTGLGDGDLIISFGDVHIYNNHFDQVREQLTRSPRKLPHLLIESDTTIDNVDSDSFTVLSYDPHPAIKAEVSV
jgi:thymidylate synthase